MIPGAFPIVAGSARFRAKGLHFDGSSYLHRGSGFSGLSDGALGTVSFWLNVPTAPDEGDAYIIMQSSNDRFKIRFTNGIGVPYGIQVRAMNSSDAVKLGITSATAFAGDDQWHHYIASWNTADSAATRMYVDGLSDAVSGGVASGNIDYTDAPYRIGSLTSGWTGSSRLLGDIGEFWFAPVYIDLSVAANLQKFRSPAGKPAYLGTDGSKPTGVVPTIYVSGPAASATVNHGAGGDFTMSGTLTDSSTSPSS